jgi:hypothetical protein
MKPWIVSHTDSLMRSGCAVISTSQQPPYILVSYIDYRKKPFFLGRKQRRIACSTDVVKQVDTLLREHRQLARSTHRSYLMLLHDTHKQLNP